MTSWIWFFHVWSIWLIGWFFSAGWVLSEEEDRSGKPRPFTVFFFCLILLFVWPLAVGYEAERRSRRGWR